MSDATYWRARKAAAARWGNREAADEATRELQAVKLAELHRKAEDLRQQMAEAAA